MHITFEHREAQYKLFQEIIGAAQGLNGLDRIHSGGAIRGAKTFTNSLALITLAKMYPQSKWSVHRKDLTILETTTIETFTKILRGLKNWHWSKSRSNYHLTYKPNGARIFFIGANESRDKDFTDTLGLEINGAFFDQLEDVSEEYYNAVLQRVGSWHIPNEPNPIVLTTCNPHPGWIKKKIYGPYKAGTLPANEMFVPLSPVNEPSNTDSQWKVWNSMPSDVKARMIEGDWDSFDNKNPFFYAFDKSKHVTTEPLQFDRSFPLLLAFDFNISPATCVVAQAVPGDFCYILKGYKLRNTTVKDLCQRILSDFPGAVYRVTGDPAGKARNAGFNSPNETMYSIIRQALNIGHGQIDTPNINYAGPDYWREMRIFCNTVLQNHPYFLFQAESAKDLIDDLTIATTEDGKDKLYKTSGDTEFGMHLTDCFVYLLTTYFNDYVKRFSQ